MKRQENSDDLPANTSILGSGCRDRNLNHNVLAADQWWQPTLEDETEAWYDPPIEPAS